MKRREEIQVNVAGLRRNIKNLAHNYSDAQTDSFDDKRKENLIEVYEDIILFFNMKLDKSKGSNKQRSLGTQQYSDVGSEIADLTYNVVAFTEIMQMIWKRLNDHGRNWRHVYKALLLLEYLIKTGSEKVAQQCQENIYSIKTLKDFQYLEDGKDCGLNVREKSKQLELLLKDEERLRNERARAIKAKERFAQSATGFGRDVLPSYSTSAPPSPPSLPINRSSDDTWTKDWNTCSSSEPPTKAELECARPQTAGEEELQLQLALAMSREEAEQEEQKKRSDDVRLQLALSQSEKEFRDYNPHQQPSSSSHFDDLLEIDPSFGQPPLVDPWGMPISAPTVPVSSRPKYDPFQSMSSPISTPSPTPVSSVPSKPDPWTPVPGQPPVKTEDPWRAVPIKPELPSSPPPPNLPARPALDPWTPTLSHSTSAAKNEEDEFATLTHRNISNSNHNGTSVSPDPFDLTSLENGLRNSPVPSSNAQNGRGSSPHSEAMRKTPQTFLGENSSLVNLDNLITIPAVPPLPVMPQKTGPAVNPFGVVSTTPSVAAANIYPRPNSSSQGSVIQNDAFQPSPARTVVTSTGLPQPLLPQPNPFLS